MALTRKFLKALGTEGDAADQIIEAHVESTDGLKAENKKLEDQLKEANEKIKGYEADDSGWKAKYEKLEADFDAYKQDQAKAAAKADKAEAYKSLLREQKIAEKRIDAILKVTDLDSIEVNADGSFKDKKALTDAIKSDWAEFIPVEENGGGRPPENPPGGGSGSSFKDLPLAEKMAYANAHPGDPDVAAWLATE